MFVETIRLWILPVWNISIWVKTFSTSEFIVWQFYKTHINLETTLPLKRGLIYSNYSPTVDIVTILQNDLLSKLTYNPDMVLLSNLGYMQKLKLRLVSYIIKVNV